MKRRKKFVAIVLGALIGTMSCMTAMAAVMSSSTCRTCGYESDIYTVTGHHSEETSTTRTCTHGKSGFDTWCNEVEERTYYCPEEGCPSWRDDATVNAYWRCDGE